MAKPLGETSALLESNASLSEPQPKAGHLPAPSASDASILDPAVEFSDSYDFGNRRRRVQPYRRGPRFDSPEPYRRQYTTSLSPHSSNTHKVVLIVMDRTAYSITCVPVPVHV